MERVYFRSGSLMLEGALNRPGKSPPFPRAVIAHPHPQFGGSMDNNVVHALFDALDNFGALTLRFNFRGVGGSEGTYGNIAGEAEDVIAADNYVKSIGGGKSDRFILAGYSFGGLCALFAMARGLAPDVLILVSPMIPEKGFMQDPDLKGFLPLKIPALIISGTDDELFDWRAYEPMVQGAGPDVKMEVVENADHFWAGSTGEIKNRVAQFLNSLPVVP